jgi:hypothetical protein
MPIPSDEGIPSLWGLLADLGEGDNRRGHTAPDGLSCLSGFWLKETNQMNQINQINQTD